MSTLFVFARIHPKDEFHDGAKEAIEEIISVTREEPGCVRFDLFEGSQDTCLYLFEEWLSPSDLDAHYDKAYTKAVFAQYDNWLAEPVTITKMHRA